MMWILKLYAFYAANCGRLKRRNRIPEQSLSNLNVLMVTLATLLKADSDSGRGGARCTSSKPPSGGHATGLSSKAVGGTAHQVEASEIHPAGNWEPQALLGWHGLREALSHRDR